MPSKTTKTVVIWDSLDAELQFFVVDRDLSHLDGKYVNTDTNPPAVDREISMLMYDEDTGTKIIETSKVFPVAAVKQGAIVITAGFLP